MTLWKSPLPLLTGERSCIMAEEAPESEPINVTEEGSPPKADICTYILNVFIINLLYKLIKLRAHLSVDPSEGLSLIPEPKIAGSVVIVQAQETQHAKSGQNKIEVISNIENR